MKTVIKRLVFCNKRGDKKNIYENQDEEYTD